MKLFALAVLATITSVPVNAEIPVKIYAQHLVDETVAKYPDVLVIMMHVTPPGSPDNINIASNIGRIGKKGDEDDMRVINTGKTNLEVAHAGERFEVELVMQEMSGVTIGALGLVFPYKAGDDQQRLLRRAEQIRDDLKARILNAGNLMEPYPFDPAATTKTHAQKLVEAMLKKHPELKLVNMHATPPGKSDNVIIATNFGRIGKKSNDENLKVIATGKPRFNVKPAPGARFGAEVALQDASGKTIGALGVAFPYEPAADQSAFVKDQAAFIKRAEQIRDELKMQIPTNESLFELDP